MKLTAVAAAAAAGSRNTAPASSSGAAGSGKKKKAGPGLGIGGASRMGGPTESSNRRAEKLDLWAVPDRELSSQITAHWDAIGPSAWPRPPPPLWAWLLPEWCRASRFIPERTGYSDKGRPLTKAINA